MSAEVACYRSYELPWTLPPEEQRRFRRILKHVLGVLAVLAVVMPFLPVPKVERHAAPEVPQRFARLATQRKPPPPPVVQELPKAVEALRVEPRPEEPKAKPAVVREAPAPEEVVPDRAAAAREKAAQSGVMALVDQLADLREHSAVARVEATRALSDAVGSAARSERSLVTSSAGRGSGGIDSASLSRNTGGGGALGGHEVTQVSGPAALAAAGRAEGDAARAAADGRRLQRSREEIELVFDRNKGAIYALYHRALREDPTLQGKLVLKLTIAPSGKVTLCEVVSSELNAPDLERKLVQRVLMFDFGARDVDEITTTKPIDFFPA
jgi:outer membrane biosynthesis protein TonB